jgi:hypothetical protein
MIFSCSITEPGQPCVTMSELHALGLIGDRFSSRPLRRVDASEQFGELRFRHIHVKRTDNGGGVGCLLVALLCHVAVMRSSLK